MAHFYFGANYQQLSFDKIPISLTARVSSISVYIYILIQQNTYGTSAKKHTCANVNTQLLCYAVKNIVSPFTYIQYGSSISSNKYLGQQIIGIDAEDRSIEI